MKTSFEDILARDFEQFISEEMDGLGDLDFGALGSGPAGVGPFPKRRRHHILQAVSAFNLVDCLVIASPVAALVAIVLLWKPVVAGLLQAFIQGM